MECPSLGLCQGVPDRKKIVLEEPQNMRGNYKDTSCKGEEYPFVEQNASSFMK
jgi:hypothetical protein